MTYAYIERTYGTTFKPGDRVRHTVTQRHGQVIRAQGDPQYYRVRFDSQRHASNAHPDELEASEPLTSDPDPADGRDEMKQRITVSKARHGVYVITREDGAIFDVFPPERGGRQDWLIESRSTYHLDHAPTLTVAKETIMNGWAPIARERA